MTTSGYQVQRLHFRPRHVWSIFSTSDQSSGADSCACVYLKLKYSDVSPWNATQCSCLPLLHKLKEAAATELEGWGAVGCAWAASNWPSLRSALSFTGVLVSAGSGCRGSLSLVDLAVWPLLPLPAPSSGTKIYSCLFVHSWRWSQILMDFSPLVMTQAESREPFSHLEM